MNVRQGIPIIVFVLLVNLFLHTAWEMWQIPFFKGMSEARHGDAVLACTQAAFGDALIALFAFVFSALTFRKMDWFLMPSKKPLFVYLSVGLIVTIIFEFLATEIWNRWAYNSRMPTLPFIGTGLTPLLQWIVIPLVSLVTVKWMYFGFRYEKYNCRSENDSEN